MGWLMLLAVLAADPAPAVSGDVPPNREADWRLCRNEKGDISSSDELKGCEALIAADDVDNEIKAIAHANRGMLMAHTAFQMTAKDELDEAIKLNPKLAPAYYNRALLLAATGDPQSAVTDYSAAISILPTMVEAYINRGIIYAESGQSELALADFTKAIQLEPGSADLYQNRAALLRHMGRAAEAEADDAKAKQLAK
jgi:tetratricopeptide (TPR) repeat protein